MEKAVTLVKACPFFARVTAALTSMQKHRVRRTEVTVGNCLLLNRLFMQPCSNIALVSPNKFTSQNLTRPPCVQHLLVAQANCFQFESDS